MRMVCAMAMPTLPTPTTEILVWHLFGDGGDVFCMGLKNEGVKSRPPGPKLDDDGAFLIETSLDDYCFGRKYHTVSATTVSSFLYIIFDAYVLTP